MAIVLVERASDVGDKQRQAQAGSSFVMLTDGDARADVTTSAILCSGAGVPTEAAPNGSIYLRTDGADADTTIYLRIAGAWVANVGT